MRWLANALLSAMFFVMFFVALNQPAFAENLVTGLPTQAYFTLEGPFDEGKLASLKPYGLDHINKVRDKDGNLVSENYGSTNGKVTALVKRKAETGHVMSITIMLNSTHGHSRYFWDVTGQSFSSCPNELCKVTTIKQCQGDDAAYDARLEQICPFVAEVVRVPKPEASPTAGTPSPVPSPMSSHHTRLIFKHP